MLQTAEQRDIPEDVRPIQMGDFLRKYVSSRILALSEGEIAALTAVGSQGGAEALVISSTSGTLDKPLARIKVDETCFFGMIEWSAVPKLGKLPSPKARSGGRLDTSCPVLCATRGSLTDAQRSWHKSGTGDGSG